MGESWLMRVCLRGWGKVRNRGEVKWISKGTDFRLKQLMNKLNDSTRRYNNMVILVVRWFILTGRNYRLLSLLCCVVFIVLYKGGFW